MSSVFNFIPQEVVTSIGWTIFHSIWQGCIVTLLLLMALHSVKSKDARLKAFLSTSALFLLLIAAVVTFSFEYNSAQKQIIINNSLFENPVSQSSLDAISGSATDASRNFASVAIAKIQNYITESLPLVVTVWGIGFIFFSIRFFAGVIGTAKLRKSITLIEDKLWVKKVEQLCKNINLQKKVRFAESGLTKVPLVLGYFKPVVLFPVGLVTGLPQDQIEAIIAHEIAHIKRYDILINFIQSFTEVIFFYNPFVWWISGKIRTERENCCDDIAIKLCGNSVAYAKALANVESFKESNEPLFAIPLFKNQNQLLRRIKRMIQKEQNQNGFKEKFAAAIIFIGILVMAVVLKSVNPATGGRDAQLNKASFFSSSIFVGDKELSDIEIDTVKSVKGKRSFSYLQKENGEMKRFKAKMKDGKLTDLYIDGEKVPDSKLSSYKEDVEEAYKKIDRDHGFSHGRNRIEISGDFFDSDSFARDMEKWGEEFSRSFNNKEFKENMKEFAEEMEEFGKEFAKSFDSKEFRRDMRDLREELEDQAIEFRSHSNSRDYRRSMDKLRNDLNKMRKELRNKKYNDEDFDSEEFEDRMDRIADKIDRKLDRADFNFDFHGLASLKNLKGLDKLKDLNIDLSGLKIGMDNFNINMKGFKEKMEVFGEKMKVFGKFIKEVKQMLVDEKIIDDMEDHVNLRINEDGIYVDDEKQSDAVFQKVKKIYKKYYDKEFDGSFHLDIGEED